jgi:hypothetical protein
MSARRSEHDWSHTERLPVSTADKKSAPNIEVLRLLFPPPASGQMPFQGGFRLSPALGLLERVVNDLAPAPIRPPPPRIGLPRPIHSLGPRAAPSHAERHLVHGSSVSDRVVDCPFAQRMNADAARPAARDRFRPHLEDLWKEWFLYFLQLDLFARVMRARASESTKSRNAGRWGPATGQIFLRMAAKPPGDGP